MDDDADLIDGGRWLTAGGIRRWVPYGHGREWLGVEEARKQRIAGLIDERFNSEWWDTPDRPDHPQVTTRRRAALAKDFEQLAAEAAWKEAS